MLGVAKVRVLQKGRIYVPKANLLIKSTGQDESTEIKDDLSARNSDDHD